MIGLAALLVAIFVLAYCLFALLFLPLALRVLPKDKAEREQWRKESRL